MLKQCACNENRSSRSVPNRLVSALLKPETNPAIVSPAKQTDKAKPCRIGTQHYGGNRTPQSLAKPAENPFSES